MHPGAKWQLGAGPKWGNAKQGLAANYFWRPIAKVFFMDCNLSPTGGSCGKIGHVDAMGSAQISQGQSAYHVHPNGLLDKLVMQRRGEGNGDVAWRNFLMRGHAIRNQATPLRQDLVSQHMFKSSWRCVSHQSTFGRPVSPAAFITCVQPLWRSSRSTDSRSWRRELAHLEELSRETTAKGTETCAFSQCLYWIPRSSHEKPFWVSKLPIIPPIQPVLSNDNLEIPFLPHLYLESSQLSHLCNMSPSW